MNQVSCIPLASVAIVGIIIILLSNCVVCHEKSANVNRKRRLTDDNDAMQLEQRQQQQQQKTSVEPNTDQRYNDNNMFKDRFNSDKIVFDRRPTTTTTTERTPTASMTINNNNPMKSNETNHQYSGTANGEYEFRWVHFIYLFISRQTTKTNNNECACFFLHTV